MIKIRKRYNQEYLYILKKEYIRDKRTTIKKNKHLGDGTRTKERWKYTRNKEIYAGKIVQKKINMERIMTFRDYLKESLALDWLSFLATSNFDKLLETYVDYMLWMHEIPKEEFETKNLYYEIGSGFLGKKTIDELYNFIRYSEQKNERQMFGFVLRCVDAGIEEKDIVTALFNQVRRANGEECLEEEDFFQSLKDEIKELKEQETAHMSYEEFIRRSKEFEKGE